MATTTAEQPREEFRAVFRELEERLVHQVLHHGHAPDVDDEHDARAHGRDVREILVRPDAEVHTTRRPALHELGDDLLHGELIRNQVVRLEETVGFG